MFSEQNRGIACRGPRPPFRRDVLLDRALQKMRQEESGCLKFSVNVRRRLSSSGYPHSSQQIGRFSAEFVARRVEKLRVLTRSDAAQQKRMDVHGAKARRPFEPPQPSRDMFGRRRLPAPVARQIRGVRHHHASTQVTGRAHFTTAGGRSSTLPVPCLLVVKQNATCHVIALGGCKGRHEPRSQVRQHGNGREAAPRVLRSTALYSSGHMVKISFPGRFWGYFEIRTSGKG